MIRSVVGVSGERVLESPRGNTFVLAVYIYIYIYIRYIYIYMYIHNIFTHTHTCSRFTRETHTHIHSFTCIRYTVYVYMIVSYKRSDKRTIPYTQLCCRLPCSPSIIQEILAHPSCKYSVEKRDHVFMQIDTLDSLIDIHAGPLSDSRGAHDLWMQDDASVWIFWILCRACLGEDLG